MRTHWVDLHTVAHELGGGGRDDVVHPLVILRMRCADWRVVADLQQYKSCSDSVHLQALGLHAPTYSHIGHQQHVSAAPALQEI